MFRRACSVAIGFGLLTAPSVSAHDFWLEPAAFVFRVGEPISVSLRVGEGFKGEAVARNPARIERFVMIGPEGERPVIGKDGDEPAGMTRATQPGIHLIGYVSLPTRIELEAARFEDYLKAEGLEHVIARRTELGESAAAGRESYARSVKSLIRVAVEGAEGYDRALGLPLEIVPLRDPTRLKPGESCTFRVLAKGQPLANVLVDAQPEPRATPATPPEPASAAQAARTDARGDATFMFNVPGKWLLCAVQMERSTCEGSDWCSTWTSLTFEIPPQP